MTTTRYALTGPRDISPLLDALQPTADRHTITVYSADDLERRLRLAEEMGIRDQVSWRELGDGE